MAKFLTRREFVALGAAALGSLAAQPVLAAGTSAPHKAVHKMLHKALRKAAARLPGKPVLHAPATPAVGERYVHVVNAHTGDAIQAVYWRQGSYLPDVMHRIDHVLRDHMSGDVHVMDPKLIDLLADLHNSLRSPAPFTIISGYRSARTNAWMARNQRGVAVNSLHVKGRAADVMLKGESVAMLHNAALGLSEGGVGYYPRSGFVHVDTGRVREWEFG